MSLALSEDDGNVWTTPLACARAEQLSYPSILEVGPGPLMVRCHVVTERWRRVAPVLFRVTEHALLET